MTTRTGSPRVPVYRQVKARMLQRLGREWKAGMHLPPVKELAAILDGGERAVLRAVQELAAEGWLESRQRRGTIVLDPTRRFGSAATSRTRSAERAPDAARPALASKTINLVATFPPQDGFILEIIDGFASAMNHAGAVVQTIGLLPNDPFWRQPVADMSRFGGDAICAINSPQNVVFSCGPEQKLILINTVPVLRVAMSGGYDIVSVDHHHGTFLAGQRLHEIGCEAVCFLGMRNLGRGGGRYDGTSAARLAGLEDGLGRQLPDHHLFECRYYDYPSGAEAVPWFMALDPRPQGIFAATDELAVGFVTGAAAHGLRAGVDFQIIGFDGQVAGKVLSDGPLSTIDIHPQRMGQTGARMLIERFTQPQLPVQRVLLGCSLFEGNTARPVPTAGA